MLILVAKKIFLEFYTKKNLFNLTYGCPLEVFFLLYKAGCFCLLLWFADIHFGPRLRPN